MSQGAFMDMLDNEHFPEYRRVAQVLSNNQLQEAEKIQCLMDHKILNPALMDDLCIINRLSSSIHGPKMFASFAEQLFAAKGYKNCIVKIIDGENQFVSSSDNKSRRDRIPSNSAAQQVFTDFRNNIRGPKGEVFVKILDDGNGNLQKFANAFLNGPRSAVYFSHAKSKSDPEKRDSIAVKISLEDNERTSKVVDHEFKALKMLEQVPNVVKLWGQGIVESKSRKLLLLQYVPHGVTDKRALSLLNINDVRSICEQVISVVQEAHKRKVHRHNWS